MATKIYCDRCGDEIGTSEGFPQYVFCLTIREGKTTDMNLSLDPDSTVKYRPEAQRRIICEHCKKSVLANIDFTNTLADRIDYFQNLYHEEHKKRVAAEDNVKITEGTLQQIKAELAEYKENSD